MDVQVLKYVVKYGRPGFKICCKIWTSRFLKDGRPYFSMENMDVRMSSVHIFSNVSHGISNVILKSNFVGETNNLNRMVFAHFKGDPREERSWAELLDFLSYHE